MKRPSEGEDIESAKMFRPEEFAEAKRSFNKVMRQAVEG
jgi:hypothetical protein